MGRLTLNVLLSFAQFERELASERVRDKLAALTRYSSGQSCASRVQRHGVTTTGTGYGSRRDHILLVRQSAAMP